MISAGWLPFLKTINLFWCVMWRNLQKAKQWITMWTAAYRQVCSDGSSCYCNFSNVKKYVVLWRFFFIFFGASSTFITVSVGSSNQFLWCKQESEVPAKEGSAEWFVGTNNSCYLDSRVKYMWWPLPPLSTGCSLSCIYRGGLFHGSVSNRTLWRNTQQIQLSWWQN